ncbi:Mce protein [Mycobacterium sp. 236(2023)]|uniref:Mce protein n=1 Tax=Mycobacterium sp. 236(2023) TaxID=3038163 RepID=UPI0024153717|nr:Mce protein [Mycobacterium sp. 236(2023)]MDG4668138.1 Mce protein [Mycobacterium sp. 236(2023)]
MTTHTTNQSAPTHHALQRATDTTAPPADLTDSEDGATNEAADDAGDHVLDPAAATGGPPEAAEPHGDAETAAAANDVDTTGRSPLRLRWSMPPHRIALLFGLGALAGVAAVCGWVADTYHDQHVADQQEAAYLQTARQGALNLTTIDWQHADTDIARILDVSTGQFRDDFSARAQDFTTVVKQTQSRTEGTIVDAGIESETPTGAQVLVAINVTSTQGNQPEQRSRGWRMRILVERDGENAKIANVEFVP